MFRSKLCLDVGKTKIYHLEISNRSYKKELYLNYIHQTTCDQNVLKMYVHTFYDIDIQTAFLIILIVDESLHQVYNLIIEFIEIAQIHKLWLKCIKQANTFIYIYIYKKSIKNTTLPVAIIRITWNISEIMIKFTILEETVNIEYSFLMNNDKIKTHCFQLSKDELFYPNVKFSELRTTRKI
ncbi:hypothetical protein AGLY_005627 [Aphis glycines]|uniref:Uncharacterized protein n=1 Tax=Aphis glycines TaxID=307491 RepID=A0A6G0TTR8_APHGL|nr:hypothetical protein AGLY_005627 [Aphis glycines]